jgi:haloalkane dehalogenase
VKILRTPDDRFDNLDGYAFAPHYTTIVAADGTPIRIHRIDEGPRHAEPIVLMHGNPTWSYLHRHMIPGLVKTGRRVIAVDLVGCGRSDKPAAKTDYTLARHVDWIAKWFEAENLRNVTLYCQDWGGTIGLHQVANHPEWFDRVVASNTGIPLGEGASRFMKMWTEMMDAATEFPWSLLAPGMTRVPRESELATLYEHATVAAAEWLVNEADDLALGRMVDALGSRAGDLADVWNAWGRLRPVLLATD